MSSTELNTNYGQNAKHLLCHLGAENVHFEKSLLVINKCNYIKKLFIKIKQLIYKNCIMCKAMTFYPTEIRFKYFNLVDI